MNKYAAYGLIFESEFDLSPLLKIETDHVADVTVKSGVVPEDGLNKPVVSRALTQVSNNLVWMNMPQIARYQIAGGNEILIEAMQDADEQSIKLYLLGSCLGAILHQRGFLVLHANAIRIDDSAVLIAGESGVGKSTAAAMFYQKGFDVISDDLVVVNKNGMAQNGISQIKLWQDTLEKLGIPLKGLNRVRRQINKYSFPIACPQARTLTLDSCGFALPVSAIYFLNQQNTNDFEFLPIEGMKKFEMLKRNTYQRHFMEGAGLKTNHLNICANLSGKAYLSLVKRPQGQFNAQELVNSLLLDLEKNGVYRSEKDQ